MTRGRTPWFPHFLDKQPWKQLKLPSQFAPRAFRLPRSKNTLPQRIMFFYVTVGWLSNLRDWHWDSQDFIFCHACAAIVSSYCKMKYPICWGVGVNLFREILCHKKRKSRLFIRSAHFYHSNSIMCSWNCCFAQDRSALCWQCWTRICFWEIWCNILHTTFTVYVERHARRPGSGVLCLERRGGCVACCIQGAHSMMPYPWKLVKNNNNKN